MIQKHHAKSLAELSPFLDTEPRSMTPGPISLMLQFDWLNKLLRKNLTKWLDSELQAPGGIELGSAA